MVRAPVPRLLPGESPVDRCICVRVESTLSREVGKGERCLPSVLYSHTCRAKSGERLCPGLVRPGGTPHPPAPPGLVSVGCVIRHSPRTQTLFSILCLSLTCFLFMYLFWNLLKLSFETIFCFLEPHPPELYLICAFKKWHRPDTVCCSLLFGRGGIASKTQCILFSGCKALTVAAAYRQARRMPTAPPLLAPGCFQPAVRCDGSHTALVHTCRTFSRVDIPRSGMAAPWNQGSADDLLEGPSHL